MSDEPITEDIFSTPFATPVESTVGGGVDYRLLENNDRRLLEDGDFRLLE